MDKIFLITMLYDFYGELLTDKQKSAMERYYLDDLSLNEIAQEHDITRQAVMDMIRRSEKILQQYEEKLHLVEKYMKQKEKLNSTIVILESAIQDETDGKNNVDKLNSVKKMLSEILD